MNIRSMKTTVALTALLALAALGLTACKKKAVDPFPASNAAQGWQKSSETRTFAAKDLWQYIDGDAEQYIAAGVVTTSTSDYKHNNQLEAVVDVHTMKDAAGAHKMLVQGQTSDGKSAQVGDEAVQYAQSITFRKGSALVRIVAYETGADTPQALLSLAQAVAGKL
jgi:hypothetical protein